MKLQLARSEEGAAGALGALPAPDPAAISRLGAAYCARHGILPLRAAGALRPVAVADAAAFRAQSRRMRAELGEVVPVPVPAAEIESTLQSIAGPALSRAAELRCPDPMSCRSLRVQRSQVIALAALALFLCILYPRAALGTGQAIALGWLAVQTALCLVAVFPRRRVPEPHLPSHRDLPVISLLLPLHREADIARMLVERIDRLDYPRSHLDAILVIERGDLVTEGALRSADLPPWVRVLRVAAGQVQTKPRAMNVALDFCRGKIVGIFDAEDAPHPDMLHTVSNYFAGSPPNVGALQGRLGFYNARAGWITRCFSIDYAAWFWVILPAIRRLGWAVPLGGTTVFIRRDALESVGGWDAHNVTEDADLGLRLARAGWRTDIIDSVTLEEATASPTAWIRQRSRWQKGYAITWAVHMRRPLRLLRDLGPWGFLGVQVLFLGSLCSAALAPLLWPLWPIALGVLPAAAGLALPVGGALAPFMAIVMWVQLTAYAVALARQKNLDVLPWVITLPLYHALSTLSFARAMADLVHRPFHWEKTAHGVSAPDPQPSVPLSAS